MAPKPEGGLRTSGQEAMPVEGSRLPGDAPAVGWLSRNRLIPIVIASALFMDLMDSAALALALPTIALHFGVPSTDLKLALTAYVVTVAVVVPASAWVAGRFGARRVFVGAMMLFVIGSMCCGMANGIEQLVASRILQGMGGAMMTPVGRAIMVGSVDRGALVRAMAWYTMPAIVAPLLGPPIAGVLLEFASWRWIFFINLPVGLIGIFAVMRFVPNIEREPRRTFDTLGFLLCASSILALMTLVETGVLAGHPMPMRAGLGLASVFLVVLYLWQARRAVSPLIDLGVLRHATFRISLAATWMQRIALGALMLVLPLQLQIGLGFSPLVASQVPAAGAIGSVLSRFVCPKGLKLMGFRPMMMSFAIATAVLSTVPALFDVGTPIALMCLFMACHAVMRASFFMAGNSLAYADVAGSEIGNASVLFAISQQLSLGLGFSIGGALLAAAGGPGQLYAFAIAYPVIALLPLGAALVTRRLPAGVGDELRESASP